MSSNRGGESKGFKESKVPLQTILICRPESDFT